MCKHINLELIAQYHDQDAPIDVDIYLCNTCQKPVVMNKNGKMKIADYRDFQPVEN